MGIVATGVPAWPEIGKGYDLSPLLVVAAAIVVATAGFRIRPTWLALTALVVGGTLTAWFGEAVGWLPALALGLVILALASSYLHRPRRG